MSENVDISSSSYHRLNDSLTKIIENYIYDSRYDDLDTAWVLFLKRFNGVQFVNEIEIYPSLELLKVRADVLAKLKYYNIVDYQEIGL